MNILRETLLDVHHGIGMGLLALLLGVVWAAYMATNHESLHVSFETLAKHNQSSQMQHLKEEMSMDAMEMGHAHDAGQPSAHKHGHDIKAHASYGQHSHSGSLATDAMQRLLRGHIHFMGVGLLSLVLLILTVSTSLKRIWKKAFGWTFGIGALTYPIAWILMGFRTVEMGPEAAEASVLWLFGPAVALLLGSMIALFLVMAVECIGLKDKTLFSWAFEKEST